MNGLDRCASTHADGPDGGRADRDQLGLHPSVAMSRQLRALRRVLRHVAEARRGRGAAPVIEIDLDLCALRPRHRTIAALKRAGERFGVGLFEHPERLAALPGYSDEAWSDFVRTQELPALYPSIQWFDGARPLRTPDSVFGAFHDAYWSTSLMGEDEPTAGLGALCHRLKAHGARVVFLSGRWLAEHEAPTRKALARAGIVDPDLVIGNPWHESLRRSGSRVLSDSAIKAYRQTQIRRRFGEPVAIFDDRASNRVAVLDRLGNGAVGIGICVPGFTHDPVSVHAEWLTSTFESFDGTLEDEPERPYLIGRHSHRQPETAWYGLYEGIGANNLPYAIPRRTHAMEHVGARPFQAMVAAHAPASLDEAMFLAECERTVPAAERTRLARCLEEARLCAARGVADSASSPTEEASLARALLASWLHSRDVEHLMAALGYRIDATGVHDMEEYVDTIDVRRHLASMRRAGAEYPDWMVRWLRGVGEPRVNVGLLNPHLIVSLWRWRPAPPELGDRARRRRAGEAAMDVHRLAAHHEGDGAERYDPIEAAVNNVLHQREGVSGIRKEPVVSWERLGELSRTLAGAEALAHSSIGIGVVRDAVRLGEALESQGVLTPWSLVRATR